MGIKIEKLMLWRVGLKEHLDTIRFIFSELAHFYEKPPPQKELKRQSFKEATFLWAEELDLKPMVKTGLFFVPAIARDKKLDTPVLLLPMDGEFLVKSKNKKSYRLKGNQILQLFDEHIFLFPRYVPTEHFFAPPFLGLVLLSSMALAGFLGSITAALAIITSTQAGYLALASLLSFAFGLYVSFAAFKLAAENYDAQLFSLILAFYRGLLTGQELLQQSFAQVSARVELLKDACHNYFFNRLLLIGSLVVFLASCLFIFWLPSLVPFFWAGYALIFMIARHLNHQEEKYRSQAFSNQQDLALALEQYRLAFQTVRGLKAFTGFERKIQQQAGTKNYEQLVAIWCWQKSLLLLGPLILFFVAALWHSFFIAELALWQIVWLATLVLLLGFVFTFGLLSFKKTRVPKLVPKVTGTHVEPVHIIGSFELIGLSFSYQDLSHLIFKNYSLSLSAELFHVITGGSGVGKTTLLKIIMGLLKPTAGQVVIDGQDLRSLNVSSLRKHFGVIFDDTNLFMGSVYDNIMCGRDYPKSLEKLLLSHEIFDALIDMPMGLQNFIFWHQKNLSHYEKALILLARALVHQPQVLFMDEFIGGLSFQDQARISDFLESLSITRILVSNNPHILAKANVIRL